MRIGSPEKLQVNKRLPGRDAGIRSGMTATITPYEDGPLILRGDFEIRTPDGTPVEPGRATVALCRCGKSAIKPFCDGTHKVINFRAGTGRDNSQE
jgi:CDGSH-type Zn-finger protein